MARDDWRIRIELPDEEGARGLLERLGLARRDAEELAQELLAHRLAVSRDSDTVFVYAATGMQAEQASGIIEEELQEHGYAPWEVRIECASLGKARELARELRDEGYGVSRTFTYVIVGTETRGQAVELARRVHGHVEPGG